METCADKLLLVFLELKHRKLLTGIGWSGETGDSSSIAIVYKQFMTLADVIGLGLQGETPDERINYFEDGKFIKKREPEKYAAVAAALEAYQPQLKENGSWQNDSFQFRYRQVTGLFIGLMSFKIKTDFRCYGLPENLSPGSEYAHFLRTGALDATAVKKIDAVLSTIIDPGRTLFDRSGLVNEYGYPAEDYESRYLQEKIDEAL
ncbi:MAG TPA: hypothetical protein VGM41_19880 [Chitinophagaceae bacterium]|jgi:hypothetical protein